MRPRRQVEDLAGKSLREEMNDVERPEDGDCFSGAVDDGNRLGGVVQHEFDGGSERVARRQGARAVHVRE